MSALDGPRGAGLLQERSAASRRRRKFGRRDDASGRSRLASMIADPRTECMPSRSENAARLRVLPWPADPRPALPARRIWNTRKGPRRPTIRANRIDSLRSSVCRPPVFYGGGDERGTCDEPRSTLPGYRRHAARSASRTGARESRRSRHDDTSVAEATRKRFFPVSAPSRPEPGAERASRCRRVRRPRTLHPLQEQPLSPCVARRHRVAGE